MLSFTSILLTTSLASATLAAVAQPAQHRQAHQGLRKRDSPCKLHAPVQAPPSWSPGAAVTTSAVNAIPFVSNTGPASFVNAGVEHGHGHPAGHGPSLSAYAYQDAAPTLPTGQQQSAPSAPTNSPFYAAAPTSTTSTVRTIPVVPTVPSSPDTAQQAPTSTYSAPPVHSSTSTSSSAASSGHYSAASAPAPNGPVAYHTYKGDGSSAMGWPTQDQWLSFDNLWTINQPLMEVSCQQWGVPNPSEQERSDLQAAIGQKSQESGVDERFILAIVLQESNGCPRAPTTTYSVANTGLCQSHEGAGSCNSAAAGVLTPCPASTIELMIDDGVQGAGTQGYNLKDKLASARSEGADEPAWAYYLAAEEYNGGSRPASGMLEDNVATKCYASDIANRLLGWSSLTGTPCTL